MVDPMTDPRFNLYLYKDINEECGNNVVVSVTGVNDILEADKAFEKMQGKHPAKMPNIVVEILRYSVPEHRARFGLKEIKQEGVDGRQRD